MTAEEESHNGGDIFQTQPLIYPFPKHAVTDGQEYLRHILHLPRCCI